jgi:hypothetical protein
MILLIRFEDGPTRTACDALWKRTMPRRSLFTLLGLMGLLLLAGCNGRQTPAPTLARPAATSEATPTAAALPPVVEPTATVVPSPGADTPVPAVTAVGSPATDTPAPEATADLLEDLEAIDTVLQEVDNQVCQEALETRAEIEALLQCGQDVSDLMAAIDELIAELEGCSLMLTPTP